MSHAVLSTVIHGIRQDAGERPGAWTAGRVTVYAHLKPELNSVQASTCKRMESLNAMLHVHARREGESHMFQEGQATEEAKKRKVTHVPERAAARRLTRVLPEENNASHCPKLRIVQSFALSQTSHCPKLRIVAQNVTNFQVGLDQHVTGMEQRKGTLVLCVASWYTERTVLSGQCICGVHLRARQPERGER